MDNKEIKAIIFDMDGVITDSESYSRKCMRKQFANNSLVLTDEFYETLLGINRARAVKLMHKEFSISEELAYKILEDSQADLHVGIRNGQVKFKKGAIELIDYLNLHHFPIALATSSNDEKIQLSFKGNNREVPFKTMINGDMVTHSKPDPEIFLKACQLLHTDPANTLVIEDSINGINAAIAAKTQCCMVVDLQQPTEEIKAQLTYLKKDLFEVLDLIKQYVNPLENDF